jgi:hypothetical protein
MVRVTAERLWHDLLELSFDLVDGFAGRQTCAVADAKDVRVDGKSLFAEGGVEDDVRRLASDSGQRLQSLARPGNFTAVVVDQRLAKCDDVFRLRVEQADGLDCLAQPLLAQVDHLLRRFHVLEQRPGRDIDARISRLRREDDSHE